MDLEYNIKYLIINNYIKILRNINISMLKILVIYSQYHIHSNYIINIIIIIVIMIIGMVMEVWIRLKIKIIIIILWEWQLKYHNQLTIKQKQTIIVIKNKQY